MNTKVFMPRFLFFLYLLGVNVFKQGEGFDAFFCRFSFVILIAYEFYFILFKPHKHSSILKWFLPFVGFYYISMIWGNFEDGIYYNNNFIQIVGILLIYSYRIHSEKDASIYLKLIVLSLLFSCYFILIRSSFSEFGSFRIGSELALNSNSVGIRLAYGAVLCLYFASSKPLYYIIYLVFSCFIILSGSRTAFVVYFTGTFLFLFFKDNNFSKFVFNIFLFILVSTIALFVVFTSEELYSLLGIRLISAWNIFNGEVTYLNGHVYAENSYDLRNEFRAYAFKMFFDSYFWGYGANGFFTEMRKVFPSYPTYSHNTYSEVLSTLGFVGGYLFFTPQLIALFHTWKKLLHVFSPYNSMRFSILVSFIIAQWGTVTYMYPIDYLVIIPIIMSCFDSFDEDKQIHNTSHIGPINNEETEYQN